MIDKNLLDFRETLLKNLIIQENLPQTDKSADDVNAHRNSTFTIKNGGSHNGTVLRENPRKFPSPSAPFL